MLIDYFCPARPNSLELDTEVSTYFFKMYPTTPITKVAFVQNYNEIYEVVVNDFGQAQYARIVFAANQMLVNAYGIAGAIALLGALFGVHLSHVLFKELRKRYNKFLIG